MTAATCLRILAGFGDLRFVLAGTVLTLGLLSYLRKCDLARLLLIRTGLCIAVTTAMKAIGLALEHLSVTGLIGSPSGHTALGTAFLGSIALILSYNRPAPTRRLISACTALAVLGLAYSRIENGAHTDFEVLQGLLIGLLCLSPLARPLRARDVTPASDAVPLWPMLLIITAMAILRAVFPVQDLDTESIVRFFVGFLPL